MSVLPDEVAAISAELRAVSKVYDVVITSGGLGPTVDDVTMQGVADALDHQLTRCDISHLCFDARLLTISCKPHKTCLVAELLTDYPLCSLWGRDQDLEHRLRIFFGSNVTHSHLKMAEAPSGECFLVRLA